jgi:hypothetical protein
MSASRSAINSTFDTDSALGDPLPRKLGRAQTNPEWQLLGRIVLSDFTLPRVGTNCVFYHRARTARQNPSRGPRGDTSAIRYLTVEVSNVADTIERYVSAGRTIVMPLFEPDPGSSVAIVEDPMEMGSS